MSDNKGQLETNFRRNSAFDDESASSQDGEREKVNVEVDEYFKTHLLHETDGAAKDDGKKRKKNQFKEKIRGRFNIFLAVFSRKLFLRHRSLIVTIVEVFFSPLMVLGILAAFTHGISWDKAHQEKIIYGDKLRFPETEIEDMKQEFRNKFCDAGGRIFLLFYPNTTLTRHILADVIDEFDIEEHNVFRDSKEFNCNKDDIECLEPTGLIACESPEEILEMALLHKKDRRKHMEPLAVVFTYDGHEKDNDVYPIIPKSVKYSIRLFSGEISETTKRFPHVEPARTKSTISPYVKHGFFGLQYAIDEAYLEIVDDIIREQLLKPGQYKGPDLLSGKPEDILKDPEMIFVSKTDHSGWPLRLFKMYHYPNFINNNLEELIKSVVSLTMLLSYSFFTFFIVKQIVTENESGIKTLLKLHSFPVYLHWIVLFVHSLFLRLISAIFLTWFLFQDYKKGSIISRSNFVIVFMFIYGHILSHTFFTFFLSTIFNGRPFASGVYVVVIGWASFVIPMALQIIGLMSFWPNLFACALFPNWAFINGIEQIIMMECDEKGMTWDNIFTKHESSQLSMIYIGAILLGSSCFYFCFAVFQDITKQKQLSYGHKWYQCGKRKREHKLQRQDHDEMIKDLKEHSADDVFQKPEVYEINTHQSIVHVRHLVTKGGKHKVVLDNVNLNFYHGEITILLGHTGSGKSSLIHVMGGMLVPTHGYVTIKGLDVNFDRKKAREYIGYCPQTIILHNLLTVIEHVTLCYRVRGINSAVAKKHAFGLLTLMRLWDYRHKTASELNETNKRKLSISLGLVNAPPVLLLDEPTAGLDSIARREVWSILTELRRHHTIIIGTNRMDEAEYLGDRIALLSHGRLVCFGTPKYLKSNYDTGYFLKIFPSKDIPFDFDKTSEIVEKYMEEKPHEGELDEIMTSNSISLELRKNRMSRFPDLFDELDREKENLGIEMYSVAQISLYDVFVKICDAVSLEGEAPDKSFRRGVADTRRKAFENIALPPILQHEEFKPTKGNSAKALIRKRLIVMGAKNKLFFWEYVVPLILIVIVYWHVHMLITPLENPNSLELSLKTYPDAEVYYRLGATNLAKMMNRSYKETLANTLKHNGLALLKTEQVLTKFEHPDSYSDGHAREKHFIGVEFRQQEVIQKENHAKKDKFFQFVGYYSSDALHGPPVVMNLITNIMLDSMFPKENKKTREILVYNHPFPDAIVADVAGRCDASCILFAALTSFALSLFVAGFIVFPTIELTTGMKHIQLMTGIHPFIYWGTEFLCDFFASLLFTAAYVAIVIAMNIASMKPTVIFDVLSIGMIIFLYLCWSTIPFAYFLSSLLPMRLSGYGTYIVLHIILGLVPVLLLNYFVSSSEPVSNGIIFLRNIMNFFPMYTVTAALHRWFDVDSKGGECLTVPSEVQAICKKTSKYDGSDSRQNLYDFIIQQDAKFAKCCDMICKSNKRIGVCFEASAYFDWEQESFEEPMLIQFCIFLFLQGFLYWGLLIFIDRGVVSNILHNAVLKFIRAHSKSIVRSRPPDVLAERNKCEEIIEQKSFPDDVALVCQDLTKSYATIMVVNDVSIVIKKGECIGVLGGGGSGKSTLCKLLCGETLATTGEVFIGDSSIHHNRVKFLSKIGYCPQNFCLFERFTPVHMIELMGRLRGIPKSELKSHVEQWLNIFGLYEARNDKCKHLTYGMRRCVCAAMCLIGGSEVILMDEPTSGIDPLCRQKFWTIMKLLTRNGRTVIFTSYNSEECSYLSSRMVVICEGNIQCLGPPHDLFQRFSRGFTILIRVRHEVLSPMEIMSATMGRVVNLKKSMKKKFKHLTLRDEQDNLLLYFLRDLGFTWGELFRRMREILDEHDEIIEKYYISEATIDEIFILLTNKYREMDAPRKMEPKQPGSMSQKEAEKKAFKAIAKNGDGKLDP